MCTRFYEAGNRKVWSYSSWNIGCSNRLQIGQTERGRGDQEWFLYAPQYMWELVQGFLEKINSPGHKRYYNEGPLRFSLGNLTSSMSELFWGPLRLN